MEHLHRVWVMQAPTPHRRGTNQQEKKEGEEEEGEGAEGELKLNPHLH